VNVYVDATVLISLGNVGELERLGALEAQPVVIPTIRDEVTTEPARTALDRVLEAGQVKLASEPPAASTARAADILDESEAAADTRLIAAITRDLDADEPVAVVSDDRRVRTIAQGLGVTVTGTIGVVVRAVAEGYDAADAKTLIRHLDRFGLHMTATLRERAVQLVDEAAGGGSE